MFIDATILANFNQALALLIGERVDDTHLWVKGEKIARHIVRLGLKNRDTQKNIFTLEIEQCTWQVLHENLVIFAYMGSIKEIEVAHKYLEDLVGEIVSNVHFNLENFSLLIRFESGYALKLLQNKEPACVYTFRFGTVYGTQSSGLAYMVGNEILYDAIWRGGIVNNNK